MPRTPLTEEQKNKLREQLVKARAVRKANLEASLNEAKPNLPAEESVKPVESGVKDEATSPPIAPKTAEVAVGATPIASTYTPDKPVTLVSLLDKQPLEVCIRDVCWRGQEITISNENYLAVHRGTTTEFAPYMTIVEEIERLLREGGYKFIRKG